MFTMNPLLRTDSYKLSHIEQYPEGITRLYSNFTPRGSRIDGIEHVVNFGLQAYIIGLTEDFRTNFFNRNKSTVLEEYRQATSTFVNIGFSLEHVAALWELGYLPLRFSQVPEGTLVPIKVPMITVENTHDDFAWLVNYIESDLSAAVWLPSTSATKAWKMRRELDEAARETGGPSEAVDFQFHDFSYRGMPNWLAAASSGAGHLLSFSGTDCVPAPVWVERYYHGVDNGLVGASVPATEHSVMCAGGKESELETFRRLIKTYPTGILSIVSDTWNFWDVLTKILPQLKDEIMAREGKIVIRPDSGNPADIVAGLNSNPNYATTREVKSIEQNPAHFGAMEILWELFGGTVNEAGYKELDPHIGLIYGDGMGYESVSEINNRLKYKGFASTNWVAGAGSFFYQYNTRDTFGFAMKATWIVKDGEAQAIFKDPITDSGLKRSARGRIAVLHQMDGTLYLQDNATMEQEATSLIQPVWEDGKWLRRYPFSEVRANLKHYTEILEQNKTI